MVHGVVRSITTQPLLSPPCYNTCGINLVLLTACILTTNLQIAIIMSNLKCKCQGLYTDHANKLAIVINQTLIVWPLYYLFTFCILHFANSVALYHCHGTILILEAHTVQSLFLVPNFLLSNLTLSHF